MENEITGKAPGTDLPKRSLAWPGRATVSVAGRTITVPSVDICGRTIVVTGRWLRIAAIRDEDWQEGLSLLSPSDIVQALRNCREGLTADIFTFSQPPDGRSPRHPYTCEWDSLAAIPLTTYNEWWTAGVSYKLRQDVKRAQKLGVVVREVAFDDVLVEGIKRIYDETPIRQGRPFWHHNKDITAVRRENSTYLERSTFLAAFLGEEIVGFIKLVYVDRVARLMQILALEAHRDKRPMNALIAKAVEVATSKQCLFLVYGNYHYSQGTDSLVDFKRRNGFKEILVPRYYVPLTPLGRVALRLRVHHGSRGLIPPPVQRLIKRVRAGLYRATVPGSV